MMRRAVKAAVLVTGAAALVAATTGPAAAGPAGVRKGTRGVLEVEYVLSGKGSQVVGGTDHTDWHATRTICFRVDLVASDLKKQAGLIPGAAAAPDSPLGRLNAAQQKHQSAIERMQAETAKCHHDQSCEARVAMEFMTSAQGAALVGDVVKAGQQGEAARPRYQEWSGVDAAGKLIAGSGSYRIEEYSKVVVYDPDCGRTNNYCTTVRRTTGAGALTFSEPFVGALRFQGAVVDTEKGLLTVSLPPPDSFRVNATEDVQTTKGGTRSRKVVVPVLGVYQKDLGGALGVTDRPISLPLREERGEKTLPLTKAFNGANGTLTVRWRFALVL